MAIARHILGQVVCHCYSYVAYFPCSVFSTIMFFGEAAARSRSVMWPGNRGTAAAMCSRTALKGISSAFLKHTGAFKMGISFLKIGS